MNLNGYTGADMMAVIREAIFRALTSKRVNKSEEIPENKNGVSFCVSKADIEEALGEVNPSGLKDIIAEIPKVYLIFRIRTEKIRRYFGKISEVMIS